jgi:hypothetical protein
MSEQILDEWQIALQQQKLALENCQQQQHLKSCLSCPKLLECEIRDAYIKSVYDSMSKGVAGGFEF